MALSNEKIDTIIAAVEKNGGATVDADGSLVMFPDGYMVSRPGEEELTHVDSPDLEEMIESYMTEKPLDSGEYYGFWLYQGVLYSDVSVYVENKSDAVNRGKRNNQIAIFDWSTMSEVFLNVNAA